MLFIDTVSIIILIGFCAKGFIRGAVADILSTVALIGGIICSIMFSPVIAGYVTDLFPSLSNAASMMVSFLFLIIATSLGVAVIARLATGFLKVVKLNWANRILGLLTGLVKGVAVIYVICTLALLFSGEPPQWLIASETVSVYENFHNLFKQYLPENLEHILNGKLDEIGKILDHLEDYSPESPPVGRQV